jgi:hypothetical protein
MRNLTEIEQCIIQRLCTWFSPQEQEDVVRDLDGVQVTEERGNPVLLSFYLRNYRRPKYKGQRPYSAEATLKAADGGEIYVILYKDQNDRLLELEFIRPDGKALDVPLPATMRRVYPFGEVIGANFKSS